MTSRLPFFRNGKWDEEEALAKGISHGEPVKGQKCSAKAIRLF